MSTSFALSAFQWRGVWGERTTSTAGKGYCAHLGHPEDETGLVYMRARYYEPTTGRFISEDLARDGGNWYLYADGNPVNRVDVDGKEAEDEFKLNAALSGRLIALIANLINIFVRAFFNGFAMPMVLGFMTFLFVNSLLAFEFRYFLNASSLELFTFLAIAGLGTAVGGIAESSALDFNELTLAGKVEGFYQLYGWLLVLTMQVFELEFQLMTGGL